MEGESWKVESWKVESWKVKNIQPCTDVPSVGEAAGDSTNLQPSTFNLQLLTFNLQPSTFNLQPSTLLFMNGQGPPFYGKYRGVVSDNRDPLMLGRVRAKVSDVLGDQESGWALPSVPYAGNGVGLFLIPPNDAWVWIEFEHGDPDYPIWTGCFWAQGELPATPAIAETKVLKTDTATITLSDVPGAGGITIETTTGMKIVMDISGVEVTNGQGATIKLALNQVSVNNGALEVM